MDTSSVVERLRKLKEYVYDLMEREQRSNGRDQDNL